MTLLTLALAAAPAHAQDASGAVFSTELRAAVGPVHPAVLLAVDPPDPDADPPDPDADPPQPDADPPDPDYGTDGRTARATLAYAGTQPLSIVVGVAELELGVTSLYFRDDAGERVVVYGEGAVERFYPPDPCAAASELPPDPCLGDLPPDPCFELVAVLADGAEMGVWIAVTADGGWVDPASVVGFNPQPDPPREFPASIQLDLTAQARADAVVTVELTFVSDGAALPVR